jgi:hypothetical protein
LSPSRASALALAAGTLECQRQKPRDLGVIQPVPVGNPRRQIERPNHEQHRVSGVFRIAPLG